MPLFSLQTCQHYLLMLLQMGDEWDDSLQSKEQIEASLLRKYEAATRRERALAYSYTHQVLTLSPFTSNA